MSVVGKGITRGIGDLERAGFRVRAKGENIEVYPASSITPELREWFVRHKPKIYEYLIARHRFINQCRGADLIGSAGLWD